MIDLIAYVRAPAHQPLACPKHIVPCTRSLVFSSQVACSTPRLPSSRRAHVCVWALTSSIQTQKAVTFEVKKASKLCKMSVRWSLRWSHTKYIQIFQMAQPNQFQSEAKSSFVFVTHIAIVYLFKLLNTLSCVGNSALNAMFRGPTFWSEHSFWLKSSLLIASPPCNGWCSIWETRKWEAMSQAGGPGAYHFLVIHVWYEVFCHWPDCWREFGDDVFGTNDGTCHHCDHRTYPRRASGTNVGILTGYMHSFQAW